MIFFKVLQKKTGEKEDGKKIPLRRFELGTLWPVYNALPLEPPPRLASPASSSRKTKLQNWQRRKNILFMASTWRGKRGFIAEFWSIFSFFMFGPKICFRTLCRIPLNAEWKIAWISNWNSDGARQYLTKQGRRYSTEVAFELLTQHPWVQTPALQIFFLYCLVRGL